MKITKENLDFILDLTESFKNKKQTVDLSSEEGRLVVRIQDELGMIRLSNIVTEDKFSKVTIEKSFLHKIRNNSKSEEELNIRINEKTVSAKTNGVSFQTNKLTDGFQANTNELKPSDNILLVTEELINALNNALKFISTNDKRPILRSVNVSNSNNNLTVVGTDAFKVYLEKLESNSNKEFSISLIPETIEVLNNIWKLTKKSFPTHILPNALVINNKAIYYASKLVEGTYPNVEAILNRMNSEALQTTIKTDADTLRKLKAIKDKDQPLQIHAENNKVKFFTKSANKESEFILEQETKNFEKAVNLDYVIMALEIIPELQIKEGSFALQSENKNILVLAMRKDQ